jgi:hypothetical protein
VSGPGLIEDYRAAVAAQLPAAVADELADGLTETYHSYLENGLGPVAAARVAMAEFGEPARTMITRPGCLVWSLG